MRGLIPAPVRAGLDMMAKIPDASAIFLANGRYHHHIGANVWQSRGAGPRDEKMNGLDDLAFSVFEPLMDGLRRRLTAADDGEVLDQTIVLPLPRPMILVAGGRGDERQCAKNDAFRPVSRRASRHGKHGL